MRKKKLHTQYSHFLLVYSSSDKKEGDGQVLFSQKRKQRPDHRSMSHQPRSDDDLDSEQNTMRGPLHQRRRVHVL